MPGRRNPLKLAPVAFTLPPPRRQRPDSSPSDDDLRLFLRLWEAGFKVSPELQQALNFRLLGLLAEKRVRLSSLQQALKDVAALTGGRLGPGWTETHACAEVARVYGLDAGSLARSWRREKKRSPKPRTKSP